MNRLSRSVISEISSENVVFQTLSLRQLRS